MDLSLSKLREMVKDREAGLVGCSPRGRKDRVTKQGQSDLRSDFESDKILHMEYT